MVAAIITTTLQSHSEYSDHQLNAAEASIAPRMHHQWEPDVIRLERGFSTDTLEILGQKGHRISVGHTMGRTKPSSLMGLTSKPTLIHAILTVGH